MFTKNELLLFDPNLIIKLLHTNVNFDYFNFGPITFLKELNSNPPSIRTNTSEATPSHEEIH